MKGGLKGKAGDMNDETWTGHEGEIKGSKKTMQGS